MQPQVIGQVKEEEKFTYKEGELGENPRTLLDKCKSKATLTTLSAEGSTRRYGQEIKEECVNVKTMGK